MDLSKPLKLQIHTGRNDAEAILESLQKYTIDPGVKNLNGKFINSY